MQHTQDLYKFILRFADTHLIMAQRLAEWCSNAPIIEEDLALSNMALDNFGQAEIFYHQALQIVNDKNATADDLAFKRDERGYYNYLMAEVENGDFAQTQVKIFLIASFLEMVYEKCIESSQNDLVLLAFKALKEVKYHKRHSKALIYRLANGTLESAQRVQEGVNQLWRFSDDFFIENEVDNNLMETIGFKVAELRENWFQAIELFFTECHIATPNHSYMVTGGINKIHTEYLGHILCEMQYLQRSMPDAIWN